MEKCCDTCIYYHWYYDHCEIWGCDVDSRSICNVYVAIKNRGNDE